MDPQLQPWCFWPGDRLVWAARHQGQLLACSESGTIATVLHSHLSKNMFHLSLLVPEALYLL